MPVQVPTAAKLKELERELAIRRPFYTKLVAQGKLKPHDANYRIEVMEAIIADYKQKVKNEPT